MVRGVTLKEVKGVKWKDQPYIRFSAGGRGSFMYHGGPALASKTSVSSVSWDTAYERHVSYQQCRCSLGTRAVDQDNCVSHEPY